MINKKYYIWIIGCQYNEWDGARLDFLMQKFGFVRSGPTEADIILIIACAVRQTAVDRILGKVNNWQKFQFKNQIIKEQKNNLNEQKLDRQITDGKLPTIIVSGCVLEPDKNKLTKKGIKFFESGDIASLTKLLKENIYLSTINDFDATSYKLTPNCCYIPITVGCNNFCSYCAVPYTRGREKSRPMKDVIADAKELIKSGHKEIMLLGQNVNSYAVREKAEGKRLKRKTDFAVLLEELNKLDGDFKISFTSNHPKDMSNDIIKAIATLPKVKKEIHLPIQSGSDKILKAMNRPYTIKQYLKIVDNIKLRIPNIKITTDVIVGFPGETEDDFQETIKVFKLVNYDVAYINKYSPRVGTAAYSLGDPINWAEKQRRWHILNKMVPNNPQT